MLMEFEPHGVLGPFIYFFSFNILVIFVLKALVSSLIWEVYLIVTESEQQDSAKPPAAPEPPEPTQPTTTKLSSKETSKN